MKNVLLIFFVSISASTSASDDSGTKLLKRFSNIERYIFGDPRLQEGGKLFHTSYIIGAPLMRYACRMLWKKYVDPHLQQQQNNQNGLTQKKTNDQRPRRSSSKVNNSGGRIRRNVRTDNKKTAIALEAEVSSTKQEVEKFIQKGIVEAKNYLATESGRYTVCRIGGNLLVQFIFCSHEKKNLVYNTTVFAGVTIVIEAMTCFVCKKLGWKEEDMAAQVLHEVARYMSVELMRRLYGYVGLPTRTV